MQRALGHGYEIIAEGLRARMLKDENPFIGDRDGYKQFGPILASHLPLDLIILLLGTNDSCSRTGKTPQEIAGNLRDYFTLLNAWCEQQHMPVPPMLIVAPSIVREQYLQGEVYIGAENTTRQLPPLYEAFAKDNNTLYFNAANVVESSTGDGVHLDAKNNKILGRELADFVELHKNLLFT
jgi:lysophospholipase L1-like esterase